MGMDAAGNWDGYGERPSGKPASYNERLRTDFGGKLPTEMVQGAPSYNLNDPMGKAAYGMTLGAGGAGADLSGVQAFLGSYNHLLSQDQFGQYKGNIDPLKGLASQIGFDTSGYDMSGSETGTSKLYNDLNEKLKNYHSIGGMSAGWDNSGDIRGGANTLYLDDGKGNLNPVSAPVKKHVDDKGNWFQENPDAVAAAAIILGGPAIGAGLAGLAGGAAATGAATTAGTAATTGAAAGGTAASTGAGLTGISGSIASALGPEAAAMWGSLPAWGQAAVTGALQGGVTSGIQGKNILQGALMGGLSGGVGAYGGQALSGLTGMPAWASKAAVSAGLGGLSSGSWQGALGAGLTSLGTSGLSGAGVNPQLASLLSRYGTGTVMGALGGGAAPSGGGGLSGGSGSSAGSRAGASGLSGGSSGLITASPLGAAQAQQANFLRNSYAPIAAEEQKRKLAQQLKDQLGDGAEF